MRAVRYDAPGATPIVLDLPRPAAPPGGVVVHVRATGVCRSDWHAWQGHEQVPLPHVPGHELVGTIAEIGSGVNGFSVGERVTVPFVCGCGRCEYCLAGQAQVCPQQTQPGFTGDGSFADYVALHAAETNLVRVPDYLDDISAAALGCRFATAYRAVAQHGRITAGQWLAVHGCGGVGLSALLIGRALGARVVAIDVSPGALSRVGELGAPAVLDGRDLAPDEIGDRVREATDGGAHVSLDALGTAATALASVRSLRRRGRHVQVGLLLGQHSTPPLPMDLVVAHELEVYGSHGLAARDYPAMLALAADLDLRSLVGRVISLDEAPQAMQALGGPASTAGMTVVDLTRAP